MSRVRALVIGLAFVAIGVAGNSSIDVARSRQMQQQGTEKAVSDASGPIRVSIMTGGGLFGPPTNRFKVGEQVPVTITMTNTSSDPLYSCDSSTLYQDLPTLVRDGRAISYSTWQSFEVADSKKNHTCQEQDLPEPVIVRPNESKVVDWFILVDSTVSTGAMAWYDSLPPGKYELSIQRRLGCCDGPMMKSNTIGFEIVP